ncbi:MAG: homoserine kinase, partial [Chloroflexi bacterium]|nr:homoserine kinase [Chloroflexota bacterium]
MRSTTVQVLVPATTANLGPGFDVLGLALNLWNRLEVSLIPRASRDQIFNYGEGAAQLPRDARHRALQAAQAVYDAVHVPRPRLRLRACNCIPLGSGLGSSAAAALAGALAANALLGWPLSRRQLLSLVARLEGHPDNAAPALYGGLTACGWDDDGQVWVRSLPVAEEWLQDGLTVWVALPAVNLSTAQARQALPEHIPLKDAAYNLGQAVRVIEAFRTGDAALLGAAMHDRWHQPYRLRLIPGASEALHAARQAGAWA